MKKLMDYLDGEKINKRNLSFYLVLIVATILFELSNSAGIALCTFLPIMLVVLFIFLKYIFPVEVEH